MPDKTKTLVVAEKPSVGRDLARVLPGPFAKHEGYLEGPEHIISWAVGHLVQLAEPDEYDPKFKRWRMADLPIVPERFKLVVRDERSRKQMAVVSTLLHRGDVSEVILLAAVYEPDGGTEPVGATSGAFTVMPARRRASMKSARANAPGSGASTA